jgi:putative glutamine amidotransferase
MMPSLLPEASDGRLYATARPVVAVTANRHVDDGVHRDIIRRRYIDALERHADVDVVILPTRGKRPCETWCPTTARLDGLVLTGDESNLDPLVFSNQPTDGDDYRPLERDRYRDRSAHAALTTALMKGLPFLGICRGLQELNVYFGGTLHNDLDDRGAGLNHREDIRLPRDRQYDPVHPVALTPDGRLATLLGRTDITTNSLHGQGIEHLGSGLVVEGRATDGLIEAIKVAGDHPFQLGVQWHPEWHADQDPVAQALLKAFGDACRERRDRILKDRHPVSTAMLKMHVMDASC